MHDVIDVRVQQGIGVGFFLEQPAGVNELGFGVCFMLGQHQNIDGDSGAKEQVGCQRNHRFHVVVVHQILADFLLSAATVEDAGEADNGGAAFAG